MLSVFLKYVASYTFFRKYGKKLLLVLSFIGFIVLVNFIYSDIVEYLTLNDMKDNLIYVLLVKWILILFSLGGIVYTIKLSFFIPKKDKVKGESKLNIDPITDTESSLIKKDELKSHGDMLIDKMKQKKKVQEK